MGLVKCTILACPFDGCPLTHEQLDERNARWFCSAGHSFDIANSGYVNLLPVQQKKSKDPGDTKIMIAARRRFLDSGFYQPIADQLTNLLRSRLPETSCTRILDAGCGDGYYLTYMLDHATPPWQARDCNLIGIDISKWAIQAASRRNRALSWIVASNRDLPLLPNSVDAIVCLFGYPQFDAFKKILKPGGLLVLADPGARHLLELRKVIYPSIRPYQPKSLSAASDAGFELEASPSLLYESPPLAPHHICDLLQMTPHLYRASQTGKLAAERLDQLSVTVDVTYRVFINCA